MLRRQANLRNATILFVLLISVFSALFSILIKFWSANCRPALQHDEVDFSVSVYAGGLTSPVVLLMDWF